MDPSVVVRQASAADLAAGAALLARELRFGDRDAIPAWHIRDTCERGGLALGAFAGARLVGFSFAFPGESDGERVLFATGLAVEPAFRGAGVGHRLKLLQGELALARGYRRVDWTADPLAAGALRLYLSSLGARLVGYLVEPYAGLRAGGAVPHDDVAIRWRPAEPPERREGDEARVELPWDRDALTAADARRWRLALRGELTPLLDCGLEGVAVVVDRARRRSWLSFRGAP